MYEDGYGLLAFIVPRDVGPVESVKLVVDADAGPDRWSLPEEKARALGEPPSFAPSLSAPDEIAWESRIRPEVRLPNDGGRGARCTDLFGLDDPNHPNPVTVWFDPDEETTTTSIDARYPPGQPSRPSVNRPRRSRSISTWVPRSSGRVPRSSRS